MIKKFVNENELGFSKELVCENKDYDVYKVSITYNGKTIIVPDFCNRKMLPELSLETVLQSLSDDYKLKSISPNYEEYCLQRGFDGTENFDTKKDYENLCSIIKQAINIFGEDFLASFGD